MRPARRAGEGVRAVLNGLAVPVAGAAGRSEQMTSGDLYRRLYFAIQVAMRAEVLSRWSAQNAASMMK